MKHNLKRRLKKLCGAVLGVLVAWGLLQMIYAWPLPNPFDVIAVCVLCVGFVLAGLTGLYIGANQSNPETEPTSTPPLVVGFIVGCLAFTVGGFFWKLFTMS